MKNVALTVERQELANCWKMMYDLNRQKSRFRSWISINIPLIVENELGIKEKNMTQIGKKSRLGHKYEFSDFGCVKKYDPGN